MDDLEIFFHQDAVIEWLLIQKDPTNEAIEEQVSMSSNFFTSSLMFWQNKLECIPSKTTQLSRIIPFLHLNINHP
jgi:hypothetical protein